MMIAGGVFFTFQVGINLPTQFGPATWQGSFSKQSAGDHSLEKIRIQEQMIHLLCGGTHYQH